MKFKFVNGAARILRGGAWRGLAGLTSLRKAWFSWLLLDRSDVCCRIISSWLFLDGL